MSYEDDLQKVIIEFYDVMFADLDKNDDKIVTLDEMLSGAREAFKKIGDEYDEDVHCDIFKKIISLGTDGAEVDRVNRDQFKMGVDKYYKIDLIK
ncbi:hypothetical protein WS90_31920 [Burkholderia cepacia]|uniref:EF-hand domain-containing protein n=1 Tax=Burkholderia cepacia TaxID=292 RepID=A0A118KCW9_BURCE|nr:hypothetical protein [Burkholderia cepacia]KVK73234.1 hypothetical protein WS90_31920 [Burkholderia cepacia]